MIYSSGKCVMALVVAMQIEKGLLDYNEKITTYWPEFGKLGKEHLLVADVLRHEAGLNCLSKPLTNYDCLRPNLKANVVGDVIEKTARKLPENNKNPDGTDSKREYHAVTRGLILNEILRRVDPKNRTFGEILREDVGYAGLCCGLDESALVRTANQREATPSWSILQTMFGNRTSIKGKDMVKMTLPIMSMVRKIRKRQPFFQEQTTTAHPFMSKDAVRMCEIPSANVHANARTLAVIASALANRGTPPEGHKQLISAKTWDLMHSEPKTAMDNDLRNMILQKV